MRLLSRMPLPFALLALALVGPAVATATAHGRSTVVGHVYVNDNSVVSSGGVLPVSVAIHHELVYVANAGSGASDYTGFRLSDHGRLEPLVGSTVVLPDSAQPGDVLFNGNGRKLVGTRVGSSEIGLVRSAASSVRPTRISCMSPTPTTSAPTAARSPRSVMPPTARCLRSDPRRSAISRQPRVGSRSPAMAGSCSQSTPHRVRSLATRSPRVAH